MQAPLVSQRPVPVSQELLRRHDVPGPRYTSYPTADRFTEAFGADDQRRALLERAQRRPDGGAAPLSLYVHVPFCESICFYCACNKVITRHRERAAEYLDALETEMAFYAAVLDGERPALQIHLGGGTPTFLSDAPNSRA